MAYNKLCAYRRKPGVEVNFASRNGFTSFSLQHVLLKLRFSMGHEASSVNLLSHNFKLVDLEGFLLHIIVHALISEVCGFYI